MTPTYARTTTLLQIAGPKTYRLASKKLFYFNDEQPGYGGNLQNIEKSQRQKFEADEGKLLCQCDQSWADAFVVACLMPKGNKLRELFENKVKIHNYLGVTFPEQWQDRFQMVKDFISIPISELKSHPDWPAFTKAVSESDDNPPATRYYYHYKQTGHSANYGIMANTFQENILLKSGGRVRLSRQQAEYYLRGYHALIPEIRNNFHRYVEHCYNRDQTLHTLQGFPIHLTQKIFPGQYNKIYDKIPQATVAIITHQAVIKWQSFVEEHKLKWDLLTNTHDSYLCQAPSGEIGECAKKMKEFMEQSLTNQYGETFTMRSECQVGKNWAPFKKDKNEEGLKTV